MPLDLRLCAKYIGRDEAFWQQVQSALDAALAIPEAQILYTKTVAALLERRSPEQGSRHLIAFADAAQAAGPLAPLGALASLLPRAMEPYLKQGADEQIIKDTFSDVMRWVDWYRREHGCDGLSELRWAVLPYANRLYQIGCLQYEKIESRLPVQIWSHQGRMLLFASGGLYVNEEGKVCHPEDAAYISTLKQQDGKLIGHLIDPETGSIAPESTTMPMNAMTLLLRQGDPALAVHIPAGTSLVPADVDGSLAAARDFFAGNGYRVCLCHSWMLDPQLIRFLPPDSRILQLASRFARFPVNDTGSGTRFIFMTDTPPDRLPPEAVRTSLQKAVMEHLRSGGHLYDFGGVMLL